MKDLEDHVFSCWRKGYKSKKICEEYFEDVSEKDVKDKFKYVFDKYFKETKQC